MRQGRFLRLGGAALAARCPAPGAARCAAAALLLTAALTAGEARAYSVDGKFGLGYEETLVALSGSASDARPDIRPAGLGIWGWLGDLGLEAVLGGNLVLGEGVPADYAGFVTLGVHYNVFRAPTVNLSAGVRLDLGFSRRVDPQTNTTEDSRFGVALEVPLRAIYFLSEQFSISGSVGPVLALPGGGVNPLTGGATATEFSLFRGGFSGGLGFTVWLR